MVAEFRYESTLDIRAARKAATKIPRSPSGNRLPTSATGITRSPSPASEKNRLSIQKMPTPSQSMAERA